VAALCVKSARPGHAAAGRLAARQRVCSARISQISVPPPAAHKACPSGATPSVRRRKSRWRSLQARETLIDSGSQTGFAVLDAVQGANHSNIRKRQRRGELISVSQRFMQARWTDFCNRQNGKTARKGRFFADSAV